MARQESLEDEPWLIVEPDPGIKDQQEKRSRLTESFLGSLSQLCSNMGVQGVQVEQICSLNRGMLHDLRYDLVNFNRDDPGHREQKSWWTCCRPIHGITLLLHHKPERSHRDDGSTTLANNVYFANQVKFMQRKTNQEIALKQNTNRWSMKLMPSMPCLAYWWIAMMTRLIWARNWSTWKNLLMIFHQW